MNNKGQINDVSIAGGLFIFLTLIGAVIFLLNVDFHNATSGTDPRDKISYTPDFSNPVGFIGSWYNLTVISVTGVPWWVWAFIVLPANLMLGFIVARNIWIGGGA